MIWLLRSAPAVTACVFMIAAVPTIAAAQPNVPPPPWLTLPQELIVPPSPDAFSVTQAYGESVFPKDAGGLLQGQAWFIRVRPKPGSMGPKPSETDVFARIKPALLAGGWTVVQDYDPHTYDAVFRLRSGGHDAWLHVLLSDLAHIGLDIIEVKPQPLKLVLTPPATKPEIIDPKVGNFPYLPPLRRSQAHGSALMPGPLRLNIRKPDGTSESTVVAHAFIQKGYTLSGLSNIQFVAAYQPALETAGWTVVERVQSPTSSDAALSAHFSGNGRDIWAYLHSSTTDYTFAVGDNRQDALAQSFAKNCHVALYGVLFDFDKATLRPESDGILQQAAKLLAGLGSAPIEVQGHTDGVGTDAYNQGLSEARAATVVAWFKAHGATAAQLSAKGYGKTKPVADNGNDEGRAKNRRVEIARPGC